MAIKTFTAGEILTAADTNTYLANSGLVYVAGASFSGITNAAPLDINSVFSATYTNYVLVLRVSQTVSNASFLSRMRTVSTLESGSVYQHAWGGGYVGAGPVFNWAGFSYSVPASPDNYWYMGISPAANNNANLVLNILSPQAALPTRFTGQAFTYYQGTYTNVALNGGGSVETNTQYTGIRLYPSAGTTSGEYAIYGYRIA